LAILTDFRGNFECNTYYDYFWDYIVKVFGENINKMICH
jgi:hypothetical protein